MARALHPRYLIMLVDVLVEVRRLDERMQGELAHTQRARHASLVGRRAGNEQVWWRLLFGRPAAAALGRRRR